ncbi:MAG: YtxH domain-containing protein [Imperialibacter sp.]|uniref:YtxH domain-containing protein n=1 Tax=Imperialibacter sp. TaxID=2038411 RepID=UPI003A844C5A
MTTGKALLGVVAGMAAGAALGLLFAPEKGEKTRKIIVDKGEDLAGTLNHKIERKFNELMDSVNAKLGKGKLVNSSAPLEHENVN